MSKKDILFLCQFFYPEHNSSATLPFDTAVHLASCGYSVDALCGYPKEYATEKNIPLSEKKDGVNIRRLRYWQLSRVGKLGRLVNYFSFTAAALCRIPRLKHYRTVIVYSNPPVLPIVALLANKLFGTKLIFVAYDVYPEVAYASHSLTSGDIIDRVMKRINRSLYQRASAVVALTEEMKAFLLAHRPELTADRVAVIPNWAHEKKRETQPEDYERFGYHEDQLIVSYFGNMGTCQDVDTMLGAMKQLRDENGIQFLVVGHGNKKETVEAQTAALPNVKVYDFLTGEAFEQATAITSCGIVSLETGLKGMCAPSKYYSYLQTGSAVLTVTERDSYLAQEVSEQQIGTAVTLGDCDALANAVRRYHLHREDCNAARERARTLYAQRYEIGLAMQKYEALLRRVIGPDRQNGEI